LAESRRELLPTSMLQRGWRGQARREKEVEKGVSVGNFLKEVKKVVHYGPHLTSKQKHYTLMALDAFTLTRSQLSVLGSMKWFWPAS
jgi:hypothetical protein